MDDKNVEKEFKSWYDKIIQETDVKFDEVFASFYDVLSQDKDAMIYVEPLARHIPHMITLLEKYFNLKKMYSEDMPDLLDKEEKTQIYFTDDEPEENQSKTLTFIGCKEKRSREVKLRKVKN